MKGPKPKLWRGQTWVESNFTHSEKATIKERKEVETESCEYLQNPA